MNVDSAGTQQLYVDFDSVQAHAFGNGGGYFSAWVGTLANPPIAEQGYQLWRERSHLFVDCLNQKAQDNYYEAYTPENTLAERVLLNIPTHTSADWQPVRAGKNGEAWFYHICSYVSR